MSDLKQKSKSAYSSQGERLTHQEIMTGCVQRIADAMEPSCKDREKLERDYKYMRDSRDSERSSNDVLRRRLAAAKGQNTKLKKKVAQLESAQL